MPTSEISSSHWIRNTGEAEAYYTSQGHVLNEDTIQQLLLSEQNWISEGSKSIGCLAFGDPQKRWSRLEKLMKTTSELPIIALAFLDCAQYDVEKAWSIVQKHHDIHDEFMLYSVVGGFFRRNEHDIILHPGLYQWAEKRHKSDLFGYICNNIRDASIKIRNASLEIDQHTMDQVHTLAKNITHTSGWKKWIQHEYKKHIKHGSQLEWLFWGDVIFENPFTKPYLQNMIIEKGPTDTINGISRAWEMPTPIKNRARNAWIFEHPQFENYRTRWLDKLKTSAELQSAMFGTEDVLLTPTSAWMYNELVKSNKLLYDMNASIYQAINTARSMDSSQREQFWEHASFIFCPNWPLNPNPNSDFNTVLSYEDAQNIVHGSSYIPMKWWKEIAFHVMSTSDNRDMLFQQMKSIKSIDNVFHKGDALKHREMIQKIMASHAFSEDCVNHYLFKVVGIEMEDVEYNAWKIQWEIAMDIGIPQNPYELVFTMRDANKLTSLELDPT